MATCIWCGAKFKKKETERDYDMNFSSMGYYYKEMVPDKDLCFDCASEAVPGNPYEDDDDMNDW